MALIILTGITWSAVHAILAALTFFGGSSFWVIWRLHLRLRTLEEGGDERNEAIFGNHDNPLHVGLAKEVACVKDELEELDAEVTDGSIERETIKKRQTRIETKLDRILDELENDF